jgi:hypothetical protein
MKWLFLFSLLFSYSFNAFSQDDPPSFFHTWLDYDYCKAIEAGNKPRELGMKSIMQIYFLPDSSKVLMGSFNEGMYRNYIFKDNENVELLDYKNEPSFLLTIKNEKGTPKLIINKWDKQFTLIPLDDKYYKINGVNSYINDKFIAGEYVSVDNETMKITFTTDGEVTGIGGFNKYDIPLFPFEFPKDLDIIILRPIDRKPKEPLPLNWKKSGDRITFYELSSEPYEEVMGIPVGMRFTNARPIKKYLELKRIR